MHLTPEELVDLAEDWRSEASAPHLASCADCRRQLTQMRALMTAAVEVAVPEPPPRFWDHLSARVNAAVAAEGAPQRTWLDVAAWRRGLMPAWAAAVASMIVVLALSSRLMAPQPPAATLNGSSYTPAPPTAALNRSPDTDVSTDRVGDAAADDASLRLVAGLTSAMDLDAASDAGLAPSGSAERAVAHMGGEELRDLQRLLKEEMGS